MALPAGVSAASALVIVVNPSATTLLSLTDGSQIWSVPSAACSSAAVGVDGTAYVGSCDGKLYALVNRYGALRWTLDSGSGAPLGAAVLSLNGSMVYTASSNGTVYAVAATSGALAWRFDAGWFVSERLQWALMGPLLCRRGTNTYTSCMERLALKYGRVWLGTGLKRPLLLGSGGVVYAGCGDGRLYAWGPSTAQSAQGA